MGSITSKKTTRLTPVVVADNGSCPQWMPARKHDPSVEKRARDRACFFRKFFTPK